MKELFVEIVDRLGIAIVTVPVVLVILFLFDRERVKRRWLWAVLLTMYLSAMYVVVGVPEWRYITWNVKVNLVPFQNLSPSNLRGMGLNAVMFLPLGFLLPAYFERYRSGVPALGAGMLTSLVMEAIQLFTLRATDVDDLIMNTLGTVVGFLLSKRILRYRPSVYQGDGDGILLLVINAVVLLSIVFLRGSLMEQIWQVLR